MILKEVKQKRFDYIISNTPNTSGVNKKKFKKLCKKYSKSEIADARNKLSIASQNLLLLNPFFGYLLLKQKVVEASIWLPTAAVDGRHLYFNTGFVNGLSIPEVQFLVCHELLHLIYGHLGRLNYPNGLPRNHKLFNIANDYIVNLDAKHAITSKQKEVKLPSSCYNDIKYLNYTSEEVYEDLLKKVLKNIKEKENKDKDKEASGDDSSEESSGSNGISGDPSGESNGMSGDSSGMSDDNSKENSNPTQSNDSNKSQDEKIDDMTDEMYPDGTFDDHLDLSGKSQDSNDNIEKNDDGDSVSKAPPELTEKDVMKRMNELKGDLLVAKETVDSSKQADFIPAGVLRVINELQEPVFNWRQYIKKYILGVKKVKISWTSPKRRSFDSNFILPGKKKEKKYKIHVAMDTSGSITEEEIRDFLSEVYGAGRQLGNVDITIWTFDTEVYNMQTYNKQNLKKLKSYDVIGNGGTLFLSNWEFMKKEKMIPDLFIMFTDGMYGDSPGIAGYCPTLYVIHGEYADRVNIDKKYGKTISYKKDAKTKRKQEN